MRIDRRTLILLFLGVVAIVAAADISAQQAFRIFASRFSSETGEPVGVEAFKAPVQCGKCHETIYGQWEGSKHASSWSNPIFQASFRLASEDTDGATEVFCASCHAPIAALRGEVPFAVDGMGLSDVAARGVSCDFCHTMSGAAELCNGGFISSPGSLQRGPFTDEELREAMEGGTEIDHENQFSAFHTKSEFCAVCHELIHPITGAPISVAYSEWKLSPYRTRGIECQNCHMSPQAGVVPRSLITPDRSGEVFTHYFSDFLGGEIFTSQRWEEERVRVSQDLKLREVATVRIVPPAALTAGGLVQFAVEVANVGSGHKLPSGMPSQRQLWLDITVSDAEEGVVFTSGKMDENGFIDRSAVKFQAVLVDAEGNPTDHFWLGTKIISDNRILPEGKASVQYAFILPETARGFIAVHAVLNYSIFAQETLNELLGEDAPRVPVLRMAEDWVRVPIGSD